MRKASTPAKPAPKAAGELARLVAAYRANPTPERRTAVQEYSAAHGTGASGQLARLALGIVAYERWDFAGSVAYLNTVKLPAIADYVSYYLAAAKVELKDVAGISATLAPVRAGAVPSPLAGRSWILEGRALTLAAPAAAARLLRERYAELPQPEGALALADALLAANDLAGAAEYYHRVYYGHISGAASERAADAIVTLKSTMGPAYPQPLPQQLLGRADRLLDDGQYANARAEYRAAIDRLAGAGRDRARVRIGAADFLGGNRSSAYQYFKGLEVDDPEADAERLYYLVEYARVVGDDEEMLSRVKDLGRHSQSPWRLKALVSAGNRFLLVNRPEDYLDLYKAVHERFPHDPAASTAHWKVAFHSWMSGERRAADLLREHLRAYGARPTSGAALYFLGRYAEKEGDLAYARACYQRLAGVFQNTYYARLARERLATREIAGAGQSEAALRFLATVSFPETVPVPAAPTRATSLRIERSRLLASAGFADLAGSEIRFGARTDGQPALLGMEMATQADAPYAALRAMKSMAPDYLNLPLGEAPRSFWELLYPLPYKSDLIRNAAAQGLDPYLLAGLIRQESEFNPQAVSRAKAYGLTQVRPATGRQYARKAGVSRFSAATLLQPAANLKIGSLILRTMLDQQDGRIEPTLAAYNAGPLRAAEWLTWRTYREPAEFVETIPFTETREYVQAVLRNAEMYRRLYE